MATLRERRCADHRPRVPTRSACKRDVHEERPFGTEQGPAGDEESPAVGCGHKAGWNSRLSGEQKLVLRDIWIYAAGLFTVTALVGLLISNFVLPILPPAVAVCLIGG